jgi:hypothetical protein
VTTLNWLYCHEDDAVATDVGRHMLNAFMILNTHLLWTREVYPTAAYQSLANLAPGPSGRGSENPEERRPVPDGIGIGDPDRLVKAIKVWEEVGVDGVNFILNTAEILSQEQVLASMRLFAAEVMPAFNSERR